MMRRENASLSWARNVDAKLSREWSVLFESAMGLFKSAWPMIAQGLVHPGRQVPFRALRAAIQDFLTSGSGIPVSLFRTSLPGNPPFLTDSEYPCRPLFEF
jgi:hypothetical protein